MQKPFVVHVKSSPVCPVVIMFGVIQMKVWQQSMGSISTPENIPRLFDMVRVKDESVRPAFYFALRDTLVAKDLEQATRVAFQKDKRWRVVTLQGQIIEQAGAFPPQLRDSQRHRFFPSFISSTHTEL